ncbi:unnamed protein product [Miscanthus lutarioriparius]|uniref:Uncharacterized protein n=1 Tax=Miscanthus lutarioriparius TaxID=422564 RepID=A0A811RQU5_9POAL|nr:unnamed protein product [Miscanthus lutarioriparius]
MADAIHAGAVASPWQEPEKRHGDMATIWRRYNDALTTMLQPFFRILSQKVANNLALDLPETPLLQKTSKASLSACGHQQQTHPMPQIQQQSSPHTEDDSKKKPTATTHTATKLHMQEGDKAPNTDSYNSYNKKDHQTTR